MLIHNANLITWGASNQVLEDHAVLLDSGLIQEIGPSAQLLAANPEVEKMDAGGQYLMPGNICTHTHFYGAYARGLSIPGGAPKDFPQILRKLWWPLDKSLDEEGVRYSALVHLIDNIKHGTTTLFDHHASPNALDGSLDIVATAVQEAGLRVALCYEVTDRDGEEKAQAGIRENVRFAERVATADDADGRLAALFGLHASLTLSDATLDACRAVLPENIGFHIHVAEHEADQVDSLAKSGQRVVPRLHQHGILGERTITAHAVHVDESEIEILAETGTWVTHQPRSNMKNGVGAADIQALLEAGVKLCLGNDGFMQGMWIEWKFANLMHKLWHRDPRPAGALDVLAMAVTNNAALAELYFPGAPIGQISPGACADLILVDYHPYTPLNAGNLPWHILYGFHESMVTGTIVSGKLLMKDRLLLNLDEAEIAAKARELAPALWERYSGFVPKE